MRISNQMSSSMVLSNMSSTAEKIFKLQSQASSGKRILQSSDDPIGTNMSLSLRASLSSIDQYSRNVERAKAQLALTDKSLGTISEALQEIKKLALTGATDTTTEEQLKNLALQVDQQIENIVQAVNTTYLNRYIFSGHKTIEKPVTEAPGGPTPWVYNGDDGEVRAQVNDSVEIGITLTARQILNFDSASDPSVPDVLSILEGLKTDLESGNNEAVSARLGQIDKSFQNIVGLRGKMGVRLMQVELHEDRLEDARLALSEWLSSTEDADIAEVIVRLQAEQNAYQASLITSARLIQSSLADYLK